MNSFSIIISTFFDCLCKINDKYVIKSDEPVSNFICEKFATENKYHVYDKFILSSPFVSDNMKCNCIEYFLKSQKIYHILCRFVRKYKVTHSIKFNPGTDLCLNDITNISELAILKIYVDHSRTLYTFRVSDIIQIINAALTYNSNFFAEPQTIKNPYTNIPFTKSELYTIYYSIKYSHFEMPFLFHQYLINGFSLIKFTYLNEQMLREIAITDFCESATTRQKYNYIHKMLVEFSDIFCPSNIDPKFPKEKIVQAFKHLLKDTLTMSFSLISALKKTSKQNIRCELREFKKYNPMYGRKLIVRKYKDNPEKPFIFGDKNRSYTIQYKFIDTIVTKKPIIPRGINTNIRGSVNRRNRLASNQRRTRDRTNLNRGIRGASISSMRSRELDEYFSWPSLSQPSENIVIDTSMNFPNISSNVASNISSANISSANVTYNYFTYNDISSSESDNETIASISSSNESIEFMQEESSSDDSTDNSTE